MQEGTRGISSWRNAEVKNNVRWGFKHSEFSLKKKKDWRIVLYSVNYTCPITEVHTFNIKVWMNEESEFGSCQAKEFCAIFEVYTELSLTIQDLKGLSIHILPSPTTTLLPHGLCFPGKPHHSRLPLSLHNSNRPWLNCCPHRTSCDRSDDWWWTLQIVR